MRPPSSRRWCASASFSAWISANSPARVTFRYVAGRKKWFRWNGRRWQADDGELQAHDLAKTVLRAFGKDALVIEDDEHRKKVVGHVLRSMRRRNIEDMIALSRSDLPVPQEAFDRDPFALNCENGTLDLRTGKLRPHLAADLISKLAPVAYDPIATAPRFEKFLSEVFKGDVAIIRYLQVFLGYACTGDTREDLFLLWHGAGRNGKTTLRTAIESVLGDYAQSARAELFLVDDSRRGGSASPQIARLAGARLVTTAELLNGTLDEGLVKSLTGGDTISARFLHADEFDFRPSAKFVISTNALPRIRGTDTAIWARIVKIPFSATFEGEACDPDLEAALAKERPGILRWLVEGAMAWHKKGLPEKPEVVATATKSYRDEQDTLARFLAERCVLADECRARQSDLYRAYKAWADESGERAILQATLQRRCLNRGFKFKSVKSDGLQTWFGLGLTLTGHFERNACSAAMFQAGVGHLNGTFHRLPQGQHKR